MSHVPGSTPSSPTSPSRICDIQTAIPQFDQVVVEVKGCTGELKGCNGSYEFQRIHKGKPIFVHVNGTQGVFHWCPTRDGGVWALNGKSTSPDSGYHFSQWPVGNPALPPSCQWKVERFECNSGSSYPEVLVTTKSKTKVPEVERFVIEVSGLTNSMAECNGSYQFDRMHRGKPLFIHINGSRGVLHWFPFRDGGVWVLNGRHTTPGNGYNFSQLPDEKDSKLPPTGQWEVQRFESNDNSAYPVISITTKGKKAVPKMDDVEIHVSGCTGDMSECNGYYEFDRLHKEKPLFLNTSGKGVFHWHPTRDGGVWALNGKSHKPELGYHFSQSADATNPMLPPAGQWKYQRFETNSGSPYPTVSIVSKTRHAMTQIGGVVVEVSGCTGDYEASNGLYEFDRMHNGKPLFMHINQNKGVIHWFPGRDGGFWALNSKSVKPECGYHFSQSPDHNPKLPPAGTWKCERWETNNGAYPTLTVMSKASAMTKVVQKRARPRLSPPDSFNEPSSPRSPRNVLTPRSMSAQSWGGNLRSERSVERSVERRVERSVERSFEGVGSPKRKLRQPEMVFA